MTPNLTVYRDYFPALQMEIDGRRQVFFDNPGGTQVPQSVADAVSRYLLTANANVHGTFATSRRTDAVIEAAHAAMAGTAPTGFSGRATRPLHR